MVPSKRRWAAIPVQDMMRVVSGAAVLRGRDQWVGGWEQRASVAGVGRIHRQRARARRAEEVVAVSMWLARRVRVSGRQCHNDESYTAWLSSPARRSALGSEWICEALNANVFSACAASCSAFVSAPM